MAYHIIEKRISEDIENIIRIHKLTRERIVRYIMDGEVITLPIEIVYNKGLKDGYENGLIGAYVQLIAQGNMNIDTAVHRLNGKFGMTREKLKEKLDEYRNQM